MNRLRLSLSLPLFIVFVAGCGGKSFDAGDGFSSGSANGAYAERS